MELDDTIVAIAKAAANMLDREPKYRLYVDEVGNADLKSSDNPNHRFLSLTGVILELNHVSQTVYP